MPSVRGNVHIVDANSTHLLFYVILMLPHALCLLIINNSVRVLLLRFIFVRAANGPLIKRL